MIRVGLGLSILLAFVCGCSKPADDATSQGNSPSPAKTPGKPAGMGAPAGAPSLAGPTGAPPKAAGSKLGN